MAVTLRRPGSAGGPPAGLRRRAAWSHRTRVAASFAPGARSHGARIAVPARALWAHANLCHKRRSVRLTVSPRRG